MIILTKDTENYLIKEGFSQLTLSRNDEGMLSLVGKKCRKHIIFLGSTPVSKKLTGAERKIVLEDYIIPTIVDHKTNLQELLVLLENTDPQDDFTEYAEKIMTKYGVVLSFSGVYQYSERTTYSGEPSSNDDYLEKINFKIKDLEHSNGILTVEINKKKISERSVSTQSLNDKDILHMLDVFNTIETDMDSVCDNFVTLAQELKEYKVKIKDIQDNLKVKCTL